MNYAQARDLPGPGDFLRPVEIDYDAAIEAATGYLFDERMASPEWVNDAQCALTDEEFRAITQAVIDGDDMEAGRLLRYGVMRAIRGTAKAEAAKNWRQILKNRGED